MDKKQFIISTELELLDAKKLNESEASISLNPLFQWAKIVVTDDQPNANKMRIPLDEFDNVIGTGIFSPIKMADKQISEGHDEAYGRPIGAISQLTKEGNRIIALAALWKKERPEEIDLLKKMYSEGNPPNVSWELSYTHSELEEDGTEALKGVILSGLTVVGNPAYAGRTPFLAMSSKQKEESSVEELETLKIKYQELESQFQEKGDLLKEKDSLLEEQEKELEALRTFKSEVDKEKADEDKLASIKKKFSDAGLEKPEEYFSDNRDTLLSLEESAIDFMIQELIAFSSKEEESSKKNKTTIPDLKDETGEEINLEDPKALGKLLREQKQIK